MISLHETERIVLVKRRHRVVLALGLIPMGIIFLILFVLLVYAAFSDFSLSERIVEMLPFLEELHIGLFIAFILSIGLLFLWQIMFMFVTTFYLDCWIVTNERTVHTELHALFRRSTSSVHHDKIQDITVDMHGILSTIFRFGDLQMQTAGAFREFVMKQIEDPHNAKTVLLQMKREAKSRGAVPSSQDSPENNQSASNDRLL